MAKQSAATDTLTIAARTDAGTTAARADRREGRIPGVLYGHGEPTPVVVTARNLELVLLSGSQSRVIDAVIDGAHSSVLLREIQRHPVSHRPLHVDFQRVTAREAVTAAVQIVLTGESKAAKNDGALVDTVSRSVDIKGPAGRIPASIEVDVTDLALHHHVSAGDLRLPQGFTLVTPPETIVVTIESPTIQREIEELDAAAAAETVAESTDAAAGTTDTAAAE